MNTHTGPTRGEWDRMTFIEKQALIQAYNKAPWEPYRPLWLLFDGFGIRAVMDEQNRLLSFTNLTEQETVDNLLTRIEALKGKMNQN